MKRIINTDRNFGKNATWQGDSTARSRSSPGPRPASARRPRGSSSRGGEGLAVDIKEPGEELAAALDGIPDDDCASATLDVRSEEDWAATLRGLRTAFGQPNVLINNAGIGSQRQAGA